jgi:23S rRNA pseudouridine1911/1915/1917 synthase
MHNANATQYVWQAQAENVGQRLDRYLLSVLTDLSRTRIQQLIEDETVLVNGRASKASYALRLHDEVSLLEQVAQLRDTKPQLLPLDVIYEDADLLIINKAVGMVVHPAPGHARDTLVNALLAHYPELQRVGSEMRPGIVHRLDKDTSGLLIVAKNTATLNAFMEQMKQHKIVKRYLALVEGVMSLEQGSIDAPIGRDPRHRQRMAITVKESRQARTHFRVLRRFARHTLLLLQLETGRTHQVRVHLQAIGHPIVGDSTYGSKSTLGGHTLHRQFLHAYQLCFSHPHTGVMMEFEAPLPTDLQNILDAETVL